MGLRIVKAENKQPQIPTPEDRILARIKDSLVQTTARRIMHTSDDSGTEVFLDKIETAKLHLSSEDIAEKVACEAAKTMQTEISRDEITDPSRLGIKKIAFDEKLALLLLG